LGVERLRRKAGKAKYCRPSKVTEEASAGHYVFGRGSGIGHVFLHHQPSWGRYMGATAPRISGFIKKPSVAAAHAATSDQSLAVL
jgi:hypothetical protein